MIKHINKVMVANRGEIAIRVLRACYDLGKRTVAIYSKEDITTLFRTKADEAYCVGEGKTPLSAYLDIERIVSLAVEKGVDAIHPGYGFLSENADFARACEEAGLVFIGPPAHILGQMGDKLSAKEIAARAGVYTIPGSESALQSLDEAKRLAQQFGYPVILKAAAGGGGRGMRLANNEAELEASYDLVKNEAEKAFGSGDVFLEKYLVEPKHIEVQVLGDKYGNIVHLFERDCSVQRRYQKVVEFTPAVCLSEEKRQQICNDAVKVAKSVGYVNAGTVEFLLDKEGNHYFIEMNPRIQVEHTVTEEVTGVDIVETQIRIAEGYSLDSPEIDLVQQNIKPRGYAIQCRVTTEDPANNFAPDTGRVTVYRSGGGNGVRLDAGNAYTGAVISPYYDSLLVKITTHDRTFEGAARKALRSINEIRVRGVRTNMPFLANVLQHPTFIEGKCDTRFIDDTPELFEFEKPQDRATKVLKYIGNIIVNEQAGEKPSNVAPRIPRGDFSNPPKGWKQLLDAQGPEAVRDAILAEKKLLITDTTLRDAHQSLLATRVRTRDMLNIARPMTHYMHDVFSLEMWGGATFDVAYRFLKESPWTRLDELRARIPNILFQMLFRGANAVGYTNYPDNLIKAFIKESAQRGIDVFRIFDSLNWLPNMELAIEEVINSGKIAQAAICYTGDILDPKRDKYPLKYYVNLAKQLEKRGAHMLCIKDMSGLVKPYAAAKLIKALKEEIGIPVDFHTHDTSGNQVAAAIMAAEAGADVVDCAIASMSSFTSQPSMNSVVSALAGSERDSLLDLDKLQKISEYWEDIRPLYSKFEAGLDHPDTEIYKLEIPGGQYSNLKPQVESLGLGHRFDEVKAMYGEVNDMLGDIVKVTPSSKMVGDLAIFMVQNGLNAGNIVERGAGLDFPDSVVSYFKGMMGQPQNGFPEDIQRVVLKGEEPVTCRPGELLEPVDFENVRSTLPDGMRGDDDMLAAALYPRVMQEYSKFIEEYGDLARMETSVFLQGMEPGESTEITIEDGKTLAIKFIGKGEANEDGTRSLVFELNGAQRVARIDEVGAVTGSARVEKAESGNDSHIGTGIPGLVSKVMVESGDKVEENQILAVIEAMKMETNIVARRAGEVDRVRIQAGQSVQAGELLITLK